MSPATVPVGRAGAEMVDAPVTPPEAAWVNCRNAMAIS